MNPFRYLSRFLILPYLLTLLGLSLLGCQPRFIKVHSNEKKATVKETQEPSKSLIQLIDPQNKSQGKESEPLNSEQLLARAILSFYQNKKEELGSHRNDIQKLIIENSEKQCSRLLSLFDLKKNSKQISLNFRPSIELTASSLFATKSQETVSREVTSKGLKKKEAEKDSCEEDNQEKIEKVIKSCKSKDYKLNLGCLFGHVIRKSIAFHRMDILQSITKRQSQSIKEYTLESAINDAIDYHNACSISTGLWKTNKLLTNFTNQLATWLDKEKFKKWKSSCGSGTQRAGMSGVQ